MYSREEIAAEFIPFVPTCGDLLEAGSLFAALFWSDTQPAGRRVSSPPLTEKQRELLRQAKKLLRKKKKKLPLPAVPTIPKIEKSLIRYCRQCGNLIISRTRQWCTRTCYFAAHQERLPPLRPKCNGVTREGKPCNSQSLPMFPFCAQHGDQYK